MVEPILCSSRLNETEQLGSFLDTFMNWKNENDAFIVAFMLADRCKYVELMIWRLVRFKLYNECCFLI